MTSGSCARDYIDGTYDAERARPHQAHLDTHHKTRHVLEVGDNVEAVDPTRLDNDLIDYTSVAWIPAEESSSSPVLGVGQRYREGSECQNGHYIDVDISEGSSSASGAQG